MGEKIASSGEEQMLVNEEEKTTKKKNAEDSMIKWEKFLPSTSVRILLVESDDSTRQIIGALLRKCSYKVASVSDGLQAWEVLKARPHNIDLILTEVELPSISGYALLTLIMEHEICKNIPVIMVSTHDSVSTVYKCMLRGAADFLVKPIRTNELKNLWQHVWRRQSMNRQGFEPQDESVGQQKLEATAENNATSDNSISSNSCARRQDKGAKKGSDAQSSCGKQDLEAESGSMAEVEDQLQLMQTESTPFDSKINEQHNRQNSGKKLFCPESLVAGPHTLGSGNHTLNQGTRLEQLNSGEDVNPYAKAGGSLGVFPNSSREAIDLIGALHNYSRPNLYTNDGANKFESAPELDLSLRRIHCDVLEDKITYEKQMLNHSNGSAFTRYVNKLQQMPNGNVTSVPTPNENEVNADDHSPDNASGSNTKTTKSLLPYERKVISLPINRAKDFENEQRNASSQRFPITFPVRGVRVDVSATPSGHGSTNPPTVHTPSPSLSPSSTNQQPNSYYQFSVGVGSGRHRYHPLDQSVRASSNQPIHQHDTQFETLDERAQAQVSSTADQSVSSRLCNGTAGHLNGFDYGTMGGNAGNVQDAALAGVFENGNDRGNGNHNLTPQRTIQREAALNKFRLKRKERCYEKKVRYESRKKLAEQRPRVKGQFVRQIPPDLPPKTGNCDSSLVAN